MSPFKTVSLANFDLCLNTKYTNWMICIYICYILYLLCLGGGVVQNAVTKLIMA